MSLKYLFKYFIYLSFENINNRFIIIRFDHNTIKIFNMQTYQSSLRKIGGYSLIISGLLAAIALCFHPDEFVPGSVLLSAWKPVHLALLVSFSISILGVVGLFSMLTSKPNFLGLTAYVLGIIGCAWSAALVVLEVFVLPGLASQASTQVPLMEMMGPATPFELLGKFFMSAVMVWILAWILIGIVILKSGQFHKYVGSLIIIASIAIAIPTHFAGGMGMPLHFVVSLLFGTSWIILGTKIIKD